MDVLKKLLLRLVFFVLSGALLTCEGRSTALFVFGDSLVDPGNSEKLITLATADRLPYGRDLVSHRPSGRFCNGLLSSDILASLAGLLYPSAYLLDKENIISGTSFASAGAGIMNLTGYQLDSNMQEMLAVEQDLTTEYLATEPLVLSVQMHQNIYFGTLHVPRKHSMHYSLIDIGQEHIQM